MINRISRYTKPNTSKAIKHWTLGPKGKPNQDPLLDSFQAIIEDQAEIIAKFEERLATKEHTILCMIKKQREIIEIVKKMKGAPDDSQTED